MRRGLCSRLLQPAAGTAVLFSGWDLPPKASSSLLRLASFRAACFSPGLPADLGPGVCPAPCPYSPSPPLPTQHSSLPPPGLGPAPGPSSLRVETVSGMLPSRSYWPALPGSSILQRLLCFLPSCPPFPALSAAALVVSPGGSAFILWGAKAAQRGGGQCKASLLQGTEVDRSPGRESSPTLCWHCLTWERSLVPVWCDPVCGSGRVLPVPPAQPCPRPCSWTA